MSCGLRLLRRRFFPYSTIDFAYRDNFSYFTYFGSFLAASGVGRGLSSNFPDLYMGMLRALLGVRLSCDFFGLRMGARSPPWPS
jgi:hypothetical protein